MEGLFEKKRHVISAPTLGANVYFCLDRLPAISAFDGDFGPTDGTVSGRDLDRYITRRTLHRRGRPRQRW